jgi:hypothetical protein
MDRSKRQVYFNEYNALKDGVYALATDLPVWDVSTPERLERCRRADVRGGS